MKDCTLNEKELILSYEIINNKIIIKYIDIYKENSEIVYSKEKELRIINTIESQLSNYKEIKNRFNNKIKNASVWIIISSFILLFNVSLLINSVTNIIAWFVLFMMSFISVANIKDINKYKKVLINLEKSSFYFENKNIFNKENNNVNIKINNVDKYTLEDLKEIRDKLLVENNNKEDKHTKKLVLKKL